MPYARLLRNVRDDRRGMCRQGDRIRLLNLSGQWVLGEAVPNRRMVLRRAWLDIEEPVRLIRAGEPVRVLRWGEATVLVEMGGQRREVAYSALQGRYRHGGLWAGLSTWESYRVPGDLRLGGHVIPAEEWVWGMREDRERGSSMIRVLSPDGRARDVALAMLDPLTSRQPSGVRWGLDDLLPEDLSAEAGDFDFPEHHPETGVVAARIASETELVTLGEGGRALVGGVDIGRVAEETGLSWAALEAYRTVRGRYVGVDLTQLNSAEAAEFGRQVNEEMSRYEEMSRLAGAASDLLVPYSETDAEVAVRMTSEFLGGGEPGILNMSEDVGHMVREVSAGLGVELPDPGPVVPSGARVVRNPTGVDVPVWSDREAVEPAWTIRNGTVVRAVGSLREGGRVHVMFDFDGGSQGQGYVPSWCLEGSTISDVRPRVLADPPYGASPVVPLQVSRVVPVYPKVMAEVVYKRTLREVAISQGVLAAGVVVRVLTQGSERVLIQTVDGACTWMDVADMGDVLEDAPAVSAFSRLGGDDFEEFG